MKNKYIKVFKKIFGNIKNIEDLSVLTSQNWDSIKHFELIGNIENEFNIELKANDIMKFNSFEKGVEILKKYKISIEF